MPSHQFSLALIQHQLATSTIQQRSSDGYINATELCQAANRRWYQYRRVEENGAFLRALSGQTGHPETQLVQEVISGDDTETWVHPQVAVHLANWLSPDFAVKVSGWVHDWLSTGRAPQAGQPAALPYHIERHMLNAAKIPPSHFSILQETTFTLTAPLEMRGHTIPSNVVPDISQGILFCKYAREHLGVDTDQLPQYEHEYPDGRKVWANLYPVELLGEFRKWVNEQWLLTRAQAYFKTRDPIALPHIDQMLKITAAPKLRLPQAKPGHTNA